ncbi:hypothetical protein Dde_3299 [Oleidesulfovibrio alaskensis G20]|uniref:Uncharacterized protein n=1 Tax=Oleidesulfovibrio alaskensis (strain ATCC BAA-1058 / DSM 17464 / G20) TaxID=207559 RepID=Q30W53_OLEA2|nr:hypothetical protein Dde_3299 [Oleidesulfovibrio alaskensis G20]
MAARRQAGGVAPTLPACAPDKSRYGTRGERHRKNRRIRLRGAVCRAYRRTKKTPVLTGGMPGAVTWPGLLSVAAGRDAAPHCRAVPFTVDAQYMRGQRGVKLRQ